MNGEKAMIWKQGGRLLALGAIVTTAWPAAAQLNVQWAEFEQQTATRLVAIPSLGVLDVDEKDQAWGDLDNDGDIDLVVVRKETFTSPGRRPNVLFMNEGGVLVDRTALYASDSDVAGDQGFLTPTNDRDVALADFNGDGFLDIATAVTISDGLPKHISHPRIYINKGIVAGAWAGFRFEAARSPQLYVLQPNGTPDLTKPNPGRFCSIAAGDVDNDGDVDLFLGDYDSSGASGSGEPAGIDLQDRLWINDSTGFFTDSAQTRMSATMLLSAFSNSAVIADMNGDGVNDVVKDTSLNPPQYVGIAYNTPGNLQTFDLFQEAHTFAPYFVSVGDLNNDGRLDMIVTDDGDDRYRLNNGNDGLGRVNWSNAFTFSFAAGTDDGFGSQSLAIDLNRDGFKDVIIADVDVDIPNAGPRRAHIYHNLGNVPNVTLKEEVELSSTAGWKGAVGFSNADLLHTVNVASFDLDNDGDNDIVLGRIPANTGGSNCGGASTPCTSVWMNKLCRLDRFGTAANNSTGQPGRIAWTGTAGLAENNLVLRASGLPPGAAGSFWISKRKMSPCIPDGDGEACVDPNGRRRELPAVANAEGMAQAALDFTTLPFADIVAGSVRYIQFRYADGRGNHNWSDALDMKVCQ